MIAARINKIRIQSICSTNSKISASKKVFQKSKMKKILQPAVVFVALIIFSGGLNAAFAQQNVPIAGGYGSASVTDARVAAAAKYAVTAQAKKQRAKITLVSVNQAEQQVVAGLNYRLCLKVDVVEKGKKTKTSKIIQAVVFQNLKQKLTLTSWMESDCSQNPPDSPTD